jgi:hypothetical protein
LPHAVQGRADERRENRERSHCHQQEEHDLAARLIHGRAEEDSPGQGYGDEGVSGPAGGGQFD